jgi:hypothetical protein
MNDADYYKAQYEALKKINKADAVIAEEHEKLWREAYRALLSAAGSNTARGWREACKKLYRLSNELVSDIFMLNRIIAKRDEIQDQAFERRDAAMRAADKKLADFFRDTLTPSKAAKTTEQPKGKQADKK